MRLLREKYRHLSALLAVVGIVIGLAMLHVITAAAAVGLVVLWQLSQFAMSKRSLYCYSSVLTPEQVREFERILRGMGQYETLFKELPNRLERLEKENDKLHTQLRQIDKRGLAGLSSSGVRRPGEVDDACARFVGSLAVISGALQGKLKGAEQLLAQAAATLGIETRTALSTTDIPMPVQYVQQIVELVYTYGTARKVATVYPITTASMKLPRLKAGEPTFGFLAMSGSVPEKSPQQEFITFTPGKAGGIVRIPSEIDADSLVSIGQFVARYIAREMAKLEDTCMFLGDGTATYNSIQGVGKQATTDGNVLQLTAGNSSPDKITLANCRGVRANVTGAVLKTASYFAHPSMDSLFVSYNTSATVVPYVRKPDGSATLDGYPIVWTPILPVYNTTAALNAYQLMFGDLSWWYFGERLSLDVQTSRDVYFATDEIGIRALERFDIHAMGQQCSSALQLSAS